jgi:DNA primase
MDLKLLKQRIYEEEKIDTLLESLNCENIKFEQSGNLIVAKLPDGDNKRSIQIKNNENLTANIRSKGINGNIFSVIGYILYNAITFDEVRENLYQIIQYICNELNYEWHDFKGEKKEDKVDWNWFLRSVQKDRKNEFKLDNIPVNKVLDENIMNQYIPILHEKWYQNGINFKTRKLFDIGYDLRSDRIIFPVHNKNGEIVGIKGRAIDDSDEKKYIYLYPCSKSIELFNYHRAIEWIQKYKKVYILEGAKSSMFSTQWNVKNCVSIEGDSLSPGQVYLLKKIGIDIELIFLFDSDKDINFIKQQVGQIRNRDIKVLKQDNGLLNINNKESPVDLGKEVYLKLIGEHLVEIN